VTGAAAAIPLLVGCYTAEAGGGGRGIVSTAVREDGSFAPVVDAAGDVPSPSFLAAHPRLPVVYAVSELAAGVLTTYDAGTPDRLRQIAAQPTGGSLPCHLAVDGDARFLAVAGYGDGSLSIFGLDAEGQPSIRVVFQHTGSGPDAERQQGPHCHQVLLLDGVSVTDLGADCVHRYRQTVDGWTAAPAGAAALRVGSGPRHVAVDGDLRYVVDELDPGVTTYLEDPATGRWEEVARAAYAGDRAGCLPSHVVLHDGFLYVANRGVDTLSVFEVAGEKLVVVAEVPTGGSWPRHFDVFGRTIVVANQHSDSLTSLVLPPGDPVPVLTAYSAVTGAPACVLVAPPQR
jgi:6-phosphogluconolactonase (cycloisomerase 2 family)